MQGRACSTCITSSIATDIGQIDGTPENFSDLVNKDALKSCCGRGMTLAHTAKFNEQAIAVQAQYCKDEAISRLI
eukprot:1146700-Pelagomonas_calceolata.AAC.5